MPFADFDLMAALGAWLRWLGGVLTVPASPVWWPTLLLAALAGLVLAALAGLRHAEALLDAARAAHQSAGRRYERGVGDIAELLNTQGAYNEARQEHLRTLAEWHVGRLVLLAAAGVLGTLDARQAVAPPR